MIWQNPWAWLGLVALVVPAIIHLLSRRRPPRQLFPTLRFLGAPRRLPAHRRHFTDLPLLAVRLGIVAAAVAALADPLLLTPARRGSDRAPARAIIVDTGASMLRLTPAGERAVDAARREGQRLFRAAATGVVIEAAAPARALPGALRWLDGQAGRREIVIVSDFQIGALDEQDLVRIPPDVGIHLSRTLTSPAAQPIETRTRQGGGETVARVTIAEDRTDVTWTVRRLATRSDGGDPLMLTGLSERRGAEADRQAAWAIGAPLPDTAHPVTIVSRLYERRAELIRDATPLDRPWMGDVVARLQNDSTLLVAARANVDGRDRLLLFSQANPGTVASAALLVAAARATATSPPGGELEPATLHDDWLARFQRPAAPDARPPMRRPGASDGRWFWLLVLALLGIETWLRRAPVSVRAVPVSEEAHERVA